jgi:hypothetical protein
MVNENTWPASGGSDVRRKLAVMLLVKGRMLPVFLASLDEEYRAVCVRAIDSLCLLGNATLHMLMNAPDLLDPSEPSNVEIAKALDDIAETAKAELATWSTDELHSIVRNAGQTMNDAAEQQKTEAEAVRRHVLQVQNARWN